jgi:hypothetical protein
MTKHSWKVSARARVYVGGGGGAITTFCEILLKA